MYVSQDGQVNKVKLDKGRHVWWLEPTKVKQAPSTGQFVVRVRPSPSETFKNVQVRRLVAGTWMQAEDVNRLGLDKFDGYIGQQRNGYELRAKDPAKGKGKYAYALDELQVCEFGLLNRGARKTSNERDIDVVI